MHLQLRCFQPWPNTFIFLPSTGMAPPWCFQFSALCFCVLWACAKVQDWLAELTRTPRLLVRVLWGDIKATGQPRTGLRGIISQPQNTQTPHPRYTGRHHVPHILATHAVLSHTKSNHNTQCQPGVTVALVQNIMALYRVHPLLWTKSRFLLAQSKSPSLSLFLFQMWK